MSTTCIYSQMLFGPTFRPFTFRTTNNWSNGHALVRILGAHEVAKQHKLLPTDIIILLIIQLCISKMTCDIQSVSIGI